MHLRLLDLASIADLRHCPRNRPRASTSSANIAGGHAPPPAKSEEKIQRWTSVVVRQETGHVVTAVSVLPPTTKARNQYSKINLIR